MTNLNKEREEIIYELLLSLNNGNACSSSDRVRLAIAQYNDLVKNEIITEWCEHDWILEEYELNKTKDLINGKYQCSKCGEVKIVTRQFDN